MKQPKYIILKPAFNVLGERLPSEKLGINPAGLIDWIGYYEARLSDTLEFECPFRALLSLNEFTKQDYVLCETECDEYIVMRHEDGKYYKQGFEIKLTK